MKTNNDDNPIAVALVYDGQGAPRVTAKSSGLSARQLIEYAESCDIPISKNEELVKLLSEIELGEEIPPTLYLAVATVIAFAYFVSGKTSIQDMGTA